MRTVQLYRNVAGWFTRLLLSGLVLMACQPAPTESPMNLPTPAPPSPNPPTVANPSAEASPASTVSSMDLLIPKPVSVNPTGDQFILTAAADIYFEPETAEIRDVARYLVDLLNPPTGYDMQVLTTADAPADGNIYLTTRGGDSALGEEGYELTITPQRITLAAYQPAGLFRGLQTLRQLLPPSLAASTVQSGPWEIPTGTIRDYPRFPWRGVMLDVARHFFGVDEVKRYMDLAAYYKLNRFHLHLSDDQGWRMMIESWPNLATHGGSVEVGGGQGGYYTQAEYAELVAYAQRRYITVVPEVDMPGHTNAVLASYAELNCNGVAPSLYTGVRVGFSSLCIEKEITFKFVDDVVREIAALTPGPYFHIGGDEAAATSEADYIDFIQRAQAIVHAYGKQAVGWEEIAQSDLQPGSIVQHWSSDLAQLGVQKGAKVIMSPATKAYLDMKYDASTSFGLDWAGHTDVRDAYDWDPATQVSGVSEGDILGVEAPLWSETLQTIADIEFMAFPRLPGYAEIGWSPLAGRNWDEYKIRLGAHGPRLTAMNVNFYRDPLIPWP